MTNYHLRPPQALPPFAWQEAKEKRKKQLAEVRRRRRLISQRMRKMHSRSHPFSSQVLLHK